MVKTLYWKNNKAYILDQLLLPARIKYIACKSSKDIYCAIKKMHIRGAPAIGVAAGFGIALSAAEKNFKDIVSMKRYLIRAIDELASSRPTAVNLFWALEKMRSIIRAFDGSPKTLKELLRKTALGIYEEDIKINKKIGENGQFLLKKNSTVITHCNAGALATAGYGTALGVIRSAQSRGKILRVLVDETRPYLQGARLTAWELKNEKIPFVLITDNMAGHLMKTSKVDACIVGADRIARNGDTANKIGTYSLAILAKYHGIPFYVAAPSSTIDIETKSGRDIKIEERSVDEVILVNGKSIAPKGTRALHPAFDVTPASLISAIITEKGIFAPGKIHKI